MKNRNFKGIYLKLNTGTDSDIINRLNKQSNKQGYVKRLIREDIAFEHFCNEAFKEDNNANKQEGKT